MLPGKLIGGVLENHGSSPIELAPMTDLAIRGEADRHMIGLLRTLMIVEMTSGTRRRCSHERAAAVAPGAFRGSMRALETEARGGLVIERATENLLPALRRVTLFAMAAQLQPVSVILPSDPVALLTFSRRALNDTVQVALATLDGAMPAHQGEIGIVVGLNEISRLFLARFGDSSVDPSEGDPSTKTQNESLNEPRPT
jgi:hypothetical protein